MSLLINSVVLMVKSLYVKTVEQKERLHSQNKSVTVLSF